jgi:hypothetical protein
VANAYSVKFADDIGPFIINRSAGDYFPVAILGTKDAPSSGLCTITTGGTEFDNVRRGDVFFLTEGQHAGLRGTVTDTSVPGSIVVTTSPSVNGSPLYNELNADFISVDWTIERSISNFRYVLPEEEFYLEMGPTPIWLYQGNPAAVTWTDGDGLAIATGGGPNYYFHPGRFTAQATTRFEVQITLSGLDNAVDSYPQTAFQVIDGAEAAALGFIDNGIGTKVQVALYDPATGLAHATSATLLDYGTYWVRIEKTGSSCNVYVDGVLHISSVTLPAYVSRPGFVFGALDSTVVVTSDFHAAVWSSSDPLDMWNTQVAAADGQTTINSEIGLNAGPFNVTAGQLIRVISTSVDNASGGNARGLWEVVSVLGSLAVVQGIWDTGAYILATDLKRVYVRGRQDAFTEDNIGNRVEIDLPTMGIDARLIDTLGDQFDQSMVDAADRVVQFSDSVNTVVTDLEACLERRWRISSDNFVNDTNVAFEVIATGTQAGLVLTLASTIPVASFLYDGIHLWHPLLEVSYETVSSAFLVDEMDVNAPATAHPFYLYSGAGWLRYWLDDYVAAGVYIDWDSLWRKPGVNTIHGLHILSGV